MDHKHIERYYRLRNLKRVSQILVLVTVLMLVSGLAVSRLILKNNDDFRASHVSSNGSRIDNFTFSSPGFPRWDLQATSAQVSDNMDKVKLSLPQVVYYGGLGGAIYLVAESGKLDKKRGLVSANGAVKIRYKDFEFASSNVDYSEGSLNAVTSAPVSLKGGNLKLTGKGLKLSVEKEEILIEHEVRASLFNVKWVAPGRLWTGSF
ncbi:MAG: LPS export ABC transporter periplasmic protein LptC [Desulfomonilaceae bacterium]